MIALVNVTYYDFKTYKEDAYILFNDTIQNVGEMSQYKNKGYTEIDVSGKLIMPGLVNGHSHIYSTFARGMTVPFNPRNFQELLEQLWWKLDRNLTNEATYYSAITSGVEYLKNGVTTIIDHHASGEIEGSLEALKKGLTEEVGLRGIYCFETSDRFDIEQCIKENNQFMIKNDTIMENGLFGMHAAFTLSDETLEKVSKENTNPIHIHIAEDRVDQDISIEKYGKRDVERLNDFNLITKDSVLSHCLYVDDNELDIIKKNEAVIALNVNSNMNNGVGLPDYQKMKEKGIKVIIGNDGISQNMTSEYQGLYYAMHHLTQSPTAFGFDDIIEIINNTYSYVSDILDCKIGKIERYYQSDLIILDYNAPTPINETNIFGHLFFGLFHNFKPNDVFVNGQRLLINKRVSTSLNNKYNESSEVAKKLWEKIENEVKQ